MGINAIKLMSWVSIILWVAMKTLGNGGDSESEREGTWVMRGVLIRTCPCLCLAEESKHGNWHQCLCLEACFSS